MRSSLRTPTATCVSGAEVHSDVDGPPRSVLLHRPEHQQDVPDIQGEQCLPDLIFLSYTFFQPVEFNQLEHEKRFKVVLILILVLITVYAVSTFVLAQIIEPGALFITVYWFTGGKLDSAGIVGKFSLFSAINFLFSNHSPGNGHI